MRRTLTVKRLLVPCALVGAALLATEGTASAQSTSIEVGGGITDYNRALAGPTDPGWAWGATLALMPTDVFGIELGYTGSQVSYEDSTGRNGLLRQNGGAAMLRVNMATGVVRPFAFGGVGASRLAPDAVLPIEDRTLVDIPAGAGLEVSIGDVFVVSGRFRYNFMLESDVVEDNAPDDADRNAFDRWTALLSVGARL